MRIAHVETGNGQVWAVQDDAGAWRETPDPLTAAPGAGGPVVSVERFLAPVWPGSQVIGLTHQPDAARPLQAWLKNPRGVIGTAAPIPLRRGVGRVQAEGELAAVLGRATAGVPADRLMDCVLGWTIANDVTDAEQAAIDPRVFQAKHARGYTPLGPWIETAPPPPDDLAVTVGIDGAPARTTATSLLGSPLLRCLAYVSRWMDLEPGDVVLTGCPASDVSIVPGNTVTVDIAGIGRLENPVR